MGLKKKHFTVIFLSSLVIGVVIFTTIVGYTLYMHWKKDVSSIKYRDSIEKLNATIFEDDITLSDLAVKEATTGPFPGKPVIAGTISNNSSKTVKSLLVEVSFSDDKGSVLYRGWFYPVGTEKILASGILDPSKGSDVLLAPGDKISFKYLLKSCPNNVARNIEYLSSFAKTGHSEDIHMECSIAGIKVL